MNIEQLYKEHYRIVYGYLLSLCGNPTLAEDLTSETFLKGILHIGDFREGKITTWLCAIGRNLYLNEQRRTRKLVELDDKVQTFGPTIEEIVSNREQAREIIRLANELPEPKRTVFFMRIRGVPFSQIADALGKRETWCRVTWHRIRQDIIKRLEGNV